MDNATLISTISVALISAIVAIYQTIANNKLARKNKDLDIELEKEKLETEHNAIKYDVVTQLLKFSQYQKIYDAVIKMMNESNVDRFLIFVAVNGKTELRKVTCIFQKYKHDNTNVDAVSVYKGLKVDNVYVNYLYDTERKGSITLETEKIEPSLIKDIYETEGVKWSNWKFICRLNLDEKNDLIAYSSAATFNEDGFKNRDLLAIKLNFESSIKPTFIETISEMYMNKNNKI
jgi:hypothetical protein